MRRHDEILQDIAGLDRQTFEDNRLVRGAVLYELLIIGEAVKLLSEEWRQQHSAIPWKQIAAMRDRLIHSYFHVRLDIVWETITKEVPELYEYIVPLLPVQWVTLEPPVRPISEKGEGSP